MNVSKVEITVFNEGEEVGVAIVLVAAGTEDEARQVSDRYREDVCPLWDERLNYKGFECNIEEVDYEEPDAEVWYLSSKTGEGDPRKMDLVSGKYSDFNSTAVLTP